jgi:hypothetical protein
MEAVCSSETLVSVYSSHGVTTQKTNMIVTLLIDLSPYIMHSVQRRASMLTDDDVSLDSTAGNLTI